MADPNALNTNAPVTAAAIVSAAGLLMAAWTDWTALQIESISAVVAILAALAVQHWHTDPKAD